MDIPSPTENVSTRSHMLADHEWLESKLEELHAACRANDRVQMQASWSDLDARLGAHLEAEERYMIPALRRWRERDASAIIEEHKHLRRRMAEIGQAIDLHTIRHETMSAFIAELRAHAQAEDKVLYQWAETQLNEPAKRSVLSHLADALKGGAAQVFVPTAR